MRAILKAVVILVASVAPLLSPASANALPADRELSDAIERLVDRRGGPPGLATLVRRGGQARFAAAGVANIETGRPWRRRDQMRIASTSKAFSGAVALALVEREVLALDDTIAELLPELPMEWGAVTLRQALHHTSGLPEYLRSEDFLEIFVNDPKRTMTPLEILSFVESERLGFPPGSAYEYSNTDNLVIALMAEAATGRSYRQLLAELVYGPANLKQTVLPWSWRIAPPRVRGYDVLPELADRTLCCNATLAGASGGIVSTVADLHRFGRRYVGADLFDPAVRTEQRDWIVGGASEPPGPGDNSAGLALFRYETRCGTVHGHTGNFPGYTQFFAASPNGRRSLVVSASTQVNEAQRPRMLERLRGVYEDAVCAALARRP